VEHIDLAHYAALRDRPNEQIARDFEWVLPPKLNVAVEICDRHARPGRPAMRWLGSDGSVREFSFEDMRDRSNRAAGVLTGLGVSRGERVFTVLGRVPEHWMVLLGALKAGAMTTCVSTTFGEDAIRVRVRDAEPRVIVTARAHEARVRPAASDVGATVILVDDDGPEGLRARLEAASPDFAAVETTPDDPAFLFYTSGTTGDPKGSVHGHGLLAGALAIVALALDLREHDVFWPTSDLAWITGVLLTFGTWAYGHPFITYEGEFDGDRWWKMLHDEKVTNFFAVPTAYRMLRLADAERAAATIRHLGTVGEPLDPDTLAWSQRRFGVPIYECYGQTENGAALCSNRLGMEIRPGSLGPPLPYLTVAIVDEDGRELPRGEVGEIASRPDYPALTQGYWHKPEETQAMFRAGWHCTGDLAHMDADGYVWFQSRKDDVISSGGYRIGPTEVEAALLSHPAVAEVGVVGKPDPTRGQIVKAWVALKPGVEESEELASELQAHCKKLAGGWNYPREVQFLPDLPKTVTGKIRRAELREIEARQSAAPASR